MSRINGFDLVRISGKGHFAGQVGVVRALEVPTYGMRYVVNCSVPFDAHLRMGELTVIGKADPDAPERDDANFCYECEQLIDLDGYGGQCGSCADGAEAMLAAENG